MWQCVAVYEGKRLHAFVRERVCIFDLSLRLWLCSYVFVRVCACVCVRESVCVHERERVCVSVFIICDCFSGCARMRVYACVCLCVCLCERECVMCLCF